jgi:hypothetical protein
VDARTLADRVQLDVIRALIAHEAEPLDRLAVLTETLERLEAMVERDIRLAYEGGASYAAVGRALGISRQAARERSIRRQSPAMGSPSHDVSQR